MNKLNSLVMDAKSYAKLLNSVAQQGRGGGHKRPLTPVECAKAIRRIQTEEGDSLEQIAERLDLGKPKNMSNMYKKRDTTQVNVFLNLLKLSDKIQDLAGWATEGYPKIPFSTVSQLSSLPTEEQDIIVQSILKSKGKNRILGKEDVKKIRKWRNENSDLPIRECIEKVLKLKPVTIVTHMVVIEIHDRLRRFIDSNIDYEEKLLGLLRRELPGKFHSIEVGNSVIAISMDDDAYKIFHDYQYDRGLSYTQFLDEFLEDKIG